MKKMKNAIPIIILFFFLLGCISQTFYQKVGRDGTSEITSSTDFTGLASIASFGWISGEEMMEHMPKVLENLCINASNADPSLVCSADGAKLTLKKSFTPDDGYYEFSSEADILSITYTLKVNSIPLDRFGVAPKVHLPIVGIGPLEKVDAIVLSKKVENKRMATQMEKIRGFTAHYVVEMPGEIIYASAGKYNAVINGSTATFDLVEVLSNSEPLIVKSEEFNLTALMLIAGAIFLVAIVVLFYMQQR